MRVNERIENLQSEIGKQMQECLASRDFNSVTALSKLLSRVQQLQKHTNEITRDVSEIEELLKSLNGKRTFPEWPSRVEQGTKEETDGLTRAGQRTLCIEVDWRANGKNRERETIIYSKAADSMVRFLSQVVGLFGEDALQKLNRIRINRGPLLSKTPTVDFLNKTQGKMYGHKRLLGTDYFVLTHSQTSQKAQDLDRICRVVGLVPGSVRISQVRKSDYYIAAYA